MKKVVGFIAGLALGVFVCTALVQMATPLASENDAVVECVEPAGGPVDMAAADTRQPETAAQPGRQAARVATVGQPAPDFEAAAYADGGFRNIRLSDYRGQWVVLCFYPGDFTFV